MEHPRLRKDLPQGEPAPEGPLGSEEHSLMLDLGAGVFEELGVINTGGTGRGAGEAAKAVIHLLAEFFRHFEIAVGDGPHQGDATARAVALLPRLEVGRTTRQTHPAMHALLDH